MKKTGTVPRKKAADEPVNADAREISVPKLAHELRTRLAIIKGAIDNVTDGIFGSLNQEQKKSLLIASEGVERMRELVEDLMASLAPGHAQMRINREIVSITDIVRRSVESMQSIAYKEGIKLTSKLPKRHVMVFCDPVKIEQVLLNLLRNSIKFTSRGGLVSIGAEENGSQVEIGVRDNGVGIPDDKLAGLFDGEQAFQTPTKDGGYRTSGLGLIIVKDILEAHGTSINVESEIGKGTIFKFCLPTTK